MVCRQGDISGRPGLEPDCQKSLAVALMNVWVRPSLGVLPRPPPPCCLELPVEQNATLQCNGGKDWKVGLQESHLEPRVDCGGGISLPLIDGNRGENRVETR